MRPIDRIDWKILRALQKNARLSNKELAAKAGVAQSTCLERVRRLYAEGILRGFHAVVAPEALGIGIRALIAVRLERQTGKHVEAFRRHALELPEVIGFYHMAGADDFLLHVAVRDAAHLRQLALSAFTSRSEVAHVETSLIFEHVACPEWPVYADLDPV